MATIVPGIKAQHAVISDTCRTGLGEYMAFEEAMRRLRHAYEQACNGWTIGKGAKIHVVLTVQRPDEPDNPPPKSAA